MTGPCRSLEEVLAAADADSEGQAPLTQEEADAIAVILAPHLHQEEAA